MKKDQPKLSEDKHAQRLTIFYSDFALHKLLVSWRHPQTCNIHECAFSHPIKVVYMYFLLFPNFALQLTIRLKWHQMIVCFKKHWVLNLTFLSLTEAFSCTMLMMLSLCLIHWANYLYLDLQLFTSTDLFLDNTQFFLFHTHQQINPNFQGK